MPQIADPGRPESLWRRTAPRIPTDPELPSRADVIVVGAGLTGVAAALMLARSGRRVAVVEARRVGSTTTGNTTGKLSLLQGQVLSGIQERNGDDLLRSYVEANRRAQRWLVSEVTDATRALETRDAVTYATTSDGDQALLRDREAALTGGLEPELLTGPALDALDLPFPVSSALRLPGQFQLHPLRVLAHLVEKLRAAGGTVVEGCRVVDAEREAAGIAVTTEHGEMHAAAVVLATGTPILDRGMFFAKLEPSRSLAAAYALDEDAVIPTDMFVSVDEPHRSIRTGDADGAPLLIVGGESFFPGRTDSVRELLQRLDGWTERWFGPARRTGWWAAQDYRTFTRLPFAAAMPRGGGRVFVATGYNKWGMTNAVAAAASIVAEIIGEAGAETVFASHPAAESAGAAIGANAEVARQLAAGWVRPRGGPSGSPPAEGRIVRSGIAPVAESTIDGVTCRVSGVCTHLGGVLEWNDAERSWDCPLHGSRFSPTGVLLEGPAVRDLAPAE